MPPRRANAIGAGSAETPEAGSEFVNESPDRAGWPRRPPRKARRRVIAGGYGEEEQHRAAGCIGRPATGGDSFTDSESVRLAGTGAELLDVPCGPQEGVHLLRLGPERRGGPLGAVRVVLEERRRVAERRHPRVAARAARRGASPGAVGGGRAGGARGGPPGAPAARAAPPP